MLQDIGVDLKNKRSWLAAALENADPVTEIEHHVILQVHDPVRIGQKLRLPDIRVAQLKRLLDRDTAFDRRSRDNRRCRDKCIFLLAQLVRRHAPGTDRRRSVHPCPERDHVALADHPQHELFLTVGIVLRLLRLRRICICGLLRRPAGFVAVIEEAVCLLCPQLRRERVLLAA